MKTIRILSLFVIVVGIIAFWLVPGINKAGSVTYVRRYENTDPIASSQLQDTTKKVKADNKINVKYYKTELIKPETKLKEIDSKMFSRSAQFEKIEELVLESVVEDSVETHLLISKDTTLVVKVAKKIEQR
jgi:hypothetical protein